MRFWSGIVIVLVVCGLASCTRPPHVQTNICKIFRQYPSWYWDAQRAQRKWGVPISVQMAIIHEESHFKAGAEPRRKKLLGFIPWARPSSAEGYAQAVNPTWHLYLMQTGQRSAPRTSFAKALDFIGWYATRAKRQLGISKTDAYALYLAYHEGLDGYRQRSYLRKGWLIAVAQRVQGYANLYHAQLIRCQRSLPRYHWWRF